MVNLLARSPDFNREGSPVRRGQRRGVGERGAVIAGAGNYSTAESIELSQEAEKMGVDGMLLVVPYYNKPPQEGLYQHFKAISESTNLPAIL